MLTPKLKKIYYAPGIVSLLILPIVLYFFTKSAINKGNNWGIPIAWVDTAYMRENNQLELFFKEGFPIKKNYKIITLSDNLLENIENLHIARNIIRKILDNRDTINGVHFVFNNNARYKTFIEVLNILREENAKHYAPLDNNIWFSYSERREKSADENYDGKLNGCFYMTDINTVPDWKSELQNNINRIWKNGWQLIVLFALFITLVIFLKTKKGCL